MSDEELPPFVIYCNDIGEGSALPVVWNMYLRTLAILHQRESIKIPAGESPVEYLTEKARSLLLDSVRRINGNRDLDSEIDEDYLFEHAVANCGYMLENMTGDPYERLENQDGF